MRSLFHVIRTLSVRLIRRVLLLLVCFVGARQSDGQLCVGLGTRQQTLGAFVVVIIHGDLRESELLFCELDVQLCLRVLLGTQLVGTAASGHDVGHLLRGWWNVPCTSKHQQKRCGGGDDEFFHIVTQCTEHAAHRITVSGQNLSNRSQSTRARPSGMTQNVPAKMSQPSLDSVRLELSVQCASIKAERGRSLGLTAVHSFQDLQDVASLHFIHRQETLRVLERKHEILALKVADMGGQVFERDVLVFRERHGPLHAVLQLANVARPRIGEQLGGGGRRDT